jgi:hypothetical protein
LKGLTRKTKLIALAATCAMALFAVAAPSANAGILVQSATNCTTPQAQQPFTHWGDSSSYVLAPQGTFEHGASDWSLSNASVVSGNDSYNIARDGGSHSLQIKSGGYALTDTICVGLDRPTLRFMAHSSGGLLGLSTMAVSVRVETSLGLVVELPIGVVTPSSKWQPSLPMPILANLLPLLPGQMTPVQFRFTPLLGGTYTIDNVYVDPRQRG